VAKYLLGTEALIRHLTRAPSPVADLRMADVAVSAISCPWIMADAELDGDLDAHQRTVWRTNVSNFRSQLEAAGGDVLALSEKAIEQWGAVALLELRDGEDEMPAEERFVVATAAANGLIYLAPARAWNRVLEERLGLAVRVVA